MSTCTKPFMRGKRVIPLMGKFSTSYKSPAAKLWIMLTSSPMKSLRIQNPPMESWGSSRGMQFCLLKDLSSPSVPLLSFQIYLMLANIYKEKDKRWLHFVRIFKSVYLTIFAKCSRIILMYC